MRSILKIMLANIRHKKGAFKGVIALMAIITMSFAINLSNDANVHRAIDEGMERSQIGDLVIVIPKTFLNDDMLDSLRNHDSVTDFRIEENLYLSNNTEIDGKKKNIPNWIAAYSERYRIFNDDCTGIVHDFSGIKKGEIYLPYKMKRQEDIKIGSTLKIQSREGFADSFTVKGYYEDILTGSVTYGKNQAIICEEDFNYLKNERANPITDAIPYTYEADNIHVFLKEGTDIKKFTKDINDECGILDTEFYTYDKETFKKYSSMIADTGCKFVYLFVLLLLVIVLITINDTIASSIELDYTSLGILKANGFTKWDIRMIFMLQYTIALIIGGALGILLSIPLTSYLGAQFMEITALYTENRFAIGKCTLIVIGIILICMAFIAFVTRRIAEISPVRAIQCGRSEVYFNGLLNTKIKSKPLGFFIAFRQITSGLKNYIGCTAITALLVYFIISVVSIAKCLDAKQLFPTSNYDITAAIDEEFVNDDMETIRKAVSAIDKNADIIFTDSYNLMVDDEKRYINMYDSEKAFQYPLEGRKPKYDNEIYITEILADDLEKSIGDKVTVSYLGKKYDYIICGYFQSVMEEGKLCQMTIEAANHIGIERANKGEIKLSDKSKEDEVLSMLKSDFNGIVKASKVEKDLNMESISDTVDTLLSLISMGIYGICIVFAAIIVYIVCIKNFQRERIDTGIYRAMGFSSSQLRTHFAIRFSIVAAAGSAAGCVSAYFLTKPMLSKIMRVLGLTNFLTDNSAFDYIIPALFITATFFVFAYIATSKVKSIGVRELVTE